MEKRIERIGHDYMNIEEGFSPFFSIGFSFNGKIDIKKIKRV